MNQALNFNEIKKKLEFIQFKDSHPQHSSEDRLQSFQSKNPHKQARESHSKRKFDQLKIDDFILYSTLGSPFLKNIKILLYFSLNFRNRNFRPCEASEASKRRQSGGFRLENAEEN
jgi:hypothetical protein